MSTTAQVNQKIVRCSARRADGKRLDGEHQAVNITRRGCEVAVVDALTRAGKTAQLDSSPQAQRVVERFPFWLAAMPGFAVQALEFAVLEVRWTSERQGRFEHFTWWLSVMPTEHPVRVLKHAIENRQAGEAWQDRKRRTYA